MLDTFSNEGMIRPDAMLVDPVHLSLPPTSSSMQEGSSCTSLWITTSCLGPSRAVRQDPILPSNATPSASQGSLQGLRDGPLPRVQLDVGPDIRVHVVKTFIVSTRPQPSVNPHGKKTTTMHENQTNGIEVRNYSSISFVATDQLASSATVRTKE